MNKLQLTFSTTAGDLEDDFPANQPLHATKVSVMARLGLDPSQGNDFVVVWNGNLLDENQTLGALGLTNGAVLIIERREAVKISLA